MNSSLFWEGTDSNRWLRNVSQLQRDAQREGLSSESTTAAFKLPLPDYENPQVSNLMKNAFRDNVSSNAAVLRDKQGQVKDILYYMNDFVDNETRQNNLPGHLNALFGTIAGLVKTQSEKMEDTVVYKALSETEESVSLSSYFASCAIFISVRCRSRRKHRPLPACQRV